MDVPWPWPPCIFSSFLLLSLALPGMEVNRAGFDLLFPPLGGWLVLSKIFPPSWMLGGAGVFVKLSEREGFRGVQFADFKVSLQLPISSHLRERDKMLLRAIFVDVFGTDSFLVRPRRMMFPVNFVAKRWRWSFVSGVYLSTFRWPRRLLWRGWFPGLSSGGAWVLVG